MNKIMNESLRKLAENYIGTSIGKKKLIVSKDDAIDGAKSASLLVPMDDDGLANRVVSRISHQEIENQKNLEAIIGMADQDLASHPDNSDAEAGEMDLDWFNHYSKYAMGVSSELMQKGWAKILAREIRKPDSFSLRTLNVMSMLSRKEAETIRKIAQYVLFSSDDEDAYILSSKTIEDVKFSEVLLMTDLGLIASSSELGLSVDRKENEGFNFLLKHKDTGLFFTSERDKMFFRIYKFTNTGMEFLRLNDDVDLNIDYVREYSEIMIKNDPTMSITCSKILKLIDNNVDMDEDHPYFRIGKKFVGDKESGY